MHSQAFIAGVAALSTLAAASPTPIYHNLKPRHRVAARPVIANTTVEGNELVFADTVTSYNWGGIVSAPPDGQYFTQAVGTFTVPSCSNPNDGTAGPWTVTNWVGIDGANNSPSLVQAGSTCVANTDGSVSYYGWVEWLPNAEDPIDGFAVNTGDEMTVTISVTSPSTADITLQSGGGPVFSTAISAPTPSATIIGSSAEWIVEDASNGGFVPFANFDNIPWSGAYAVTNAQGQTAALDYPYNVWNLQLDNGSDRDGSEVTFYQAGDQSSWTISNSG